MTSMKRNGGTAPWDKASEQVRIQTVAERYPVFQIEPKGPNIAFHRTACGRL